MSDHPTTGGCLCGAVRYESPDAPARTHFCHCNMCKRMSGGPFAYLAGFRKDRLTFTRGSPAYYRSSDRARRGFCPTCGSHLLYESLSPGAEYVYMAGGSLDHPEEAPITRHFGTSGWLPWLHIDDTLPREED